MQTRSESISEIAGALAKAQAEMSGALTDSFNPFFKSKYADLASVWNACRLPLSKNGLSVVQSPTNDGNGNVTVVTTLMHSSGEWIENSLTLKAPKVDAQAIGSVITYARRFALSALVGVYQDDEDGQVQDNPKEPKTNGTDTQKVVMRSFTDEAFTSELEKHKSKVVSGKRTADQLIEYFCRTGSLTDEQVKTIKEIKVEQ